MSGYAYNRTRLTVVLFLIAANFTGAVVSTINRRYPLGLAPILFLIPCLLRELDLRNGQRPRRIGLFEYSCFIGGLLFLLVMPFLIG